MPSSQGLGVGGLVDFAEIEGEVGGNVGVGLVDAAVDDGDADAFAHGGVPWAVGWTAGDVVAIAADLLDGPVLRGGGRRCRRAGGGGGGGGADDWGYRRWGRGWAVAGRKRGVGGLSSGCLCRLRPE